MTKKEKAHLGSGPIPNAVVIHDAPESIAALTDIQAADALARRVFGHSFLVVREPIGDRFRKRAPSRIRAWRAAQ